jgi:TPR repeat protein
MYTNGEGVARDNAEAVKWYRKAAEQGYVDAQYNLGLMYEDGDGVAEDDIFAYMWWNLAAAQGHEKAKENKGNLTERMAREQIAEAQKLSREWLAKHAKP